MIKTMRGSIQLGYTIEEGESLPSTEEEKQEAIRAEIGVDLVVILHSMADLFGEEEALKIYTKSAAVFVEEV